MLVAFTDENKRFFCFFFDSFIFIGSGRTLHFNELFIVFGVP